MKAPIPLNRLFWPDARGWIGIGVFALSVMLLMMMKDPALRNDEFFQTIATVIISNGLMAVVAWAYSATKGGGEQAEATVQVAQTLADKAHIPNGDTPTQPVAAPEELPEYAR